MAEFDYARMQRVATRLLTRFSQGTITLTKVTPVEGDDPWNPGESTTVVHTLQGTAKGVSKEFIDGTTIVATDIEITAAAFGAEPEMDDTLAVDGKAVTMVRIIRVPAAGTVVAWKFVVRG